MSEKYPEWFELPAKRWKNNPESYWERDSQRQKLYDAESYAGYKMNKQNLNPKFTSIEEIQKFTDKLISSAWFKRRWGEHSIEIVQQNRGRAAYARFNRIHLPKWAWISMIVLHEITHIAGSRKTSSGASHSRFFARTFLELVDHVLGPKAKKILREEFKRERVKYTPKYQLTNKDRQARRERFVRNVLNVTNC